MVSAYRPQTFEEALLIRQEHRVIPFAGGTDLMVKYRRHTGLAPQFELPIVLLGHLQELRFVDVSSDELVIGAATTLADLVSHEATPEALRLAAGEIASPALRNVATLVGNVCNASPAGDTLPALYCLNASLILASSDGERRVAVDGFMLGPGQTVLRGDELVKAVSIPRESVDQIHYRKVGTRQANALSKLSFLGLAHTEGQSVLDLRIAFGAVAPTIVRSKELEREYSGLSKSDLARQLPALLDAYSKLIVPIDDQRSTAHYRKAVSAEAAGTIRWGHNQRGTLSGLAERLCRRKRM